MFGISLQNKRFLLATVFHPDSIVFCLFSHAIKCGFQFDSNLDVFPTQTPRTYFTRKKLSCLLPQVNRKSLANLPNAAQESTIKVTGGISCYLMTFYCFNRFRFRSFRAARAHWRHWRQRRSPSFRQHPSTLPRDGCHERSTRNQRLPPRSCRSWRRKWRQIQAWVGWEFLLIFVSHLRAGE